MIPAAERFDVGGTPQQNAALAVIMFAAMATDHVAAEDRMVDQASAAGIVSDMLLAAAAGGFTGSGEFRALVGAGQMTPRLEQLAAYIVRFVGGPAAIFNMFAMAATPAGAMGAAQ